MTEIHRLSKHMETKKYYMYFFILRVFATLYTAAGWAASLKKKKKNTLRVRGSSLTFCLLRKHTYSNILKISPPKTESFEIKILIFFHISAHNIDCGYSLEPPRRVPTTYIFEQK